jgi:hypothetical protein
MREATKKIALARVQKRYLLHCYAILEMEQTAFLTEEIIDSQ